MNKNNFFSVFILMASILTTGNAKAALVNDGTILLTIDPGDVYCPLGGVYPRCIIQSSPRSGSYATIELEYRALTQGEGIILGTTQGYNGNTVNGIDSPYDGSGQHITAPWLGSAVNDPTGSSFIYPEGVNWTDSPITADNAGNLDLSGWRATWYDAAIIDLSGGGNGTFQCFGLNGLKAAGTCEIGDSYTLDYSTFVENSGFPVNGTYELHLEGQITRLSQVPVPAAMWLFVSGIISLIGFNNINRRKIRNS